MFTIRGKQSWICMNQCMVCDSKAGEDNLNRTCLPTGNNPVILLHCKGSEPCHEVVLRSLPQIYKEQRIHMDSSIQGSSVKVLRSSGEIDEWKVLYMRWSASQKDFIVEVGPTSIYDITKSLRVRELIELNPNLEIKVIIPDVDVNHFSEALSVKEGLVTL